MSGNEENKKGENMKEWNEGREIQSENFFLKSESKITGIQLCIRLFVEQINLQVLLHVTD